MFAFETRSLLFNIKQLVKQGGIIHATGMGYDLTCDNNEISCVIVALWRLSCASKNLSWVAWNSWFAFLAALILYIGNSKWLPWPCVKGMIKSKMWNSCVTLMVTERTEIFGMNNLRVVSHWFTPMVIGHMVSCDSALHMNLTLHQFCFGSASDSKAELEHIATFSFFYLGPVG